MLKFFRLSFRLHLFSPQLRNHVQQEYIPVGCIPPAYWPYLVVSAGGCTCLGGLLYLPRRCTCSRGCTCPVGVPAQGCTCSGGGGVPARGCTCPGVYLPGGCTCSRGRGCTCQGVYLPRGCTCLGGVPAPGSVPARGVSARGAPAQGGVPAQWGCTFWGVSARGVPAQVLPLWVQNYWHTLLKILPCPKLHLR